MNTEFDFTHLLNHYQFGYDLNSIIFGCLIFFTLIIIGKYSINYLNNEVGEYRFWTLFTFFAIGIGICCFSKNLSMFYLGWEIVGLTSFFLIGFYQTNVRSVENSLIALSNYKICDVFFVLAIFFEESHMHLQCGFCLIIATIAKSALFPLSSWLYRSLEGPTPSSTLFYGGLSLHLGSFALIQFSSFWDDSLSLKLLIGILGALSALYGFLVGATRSDLKTSFAFASISQVGLIYIEIALGYYHLALWHIIGHNLLRTWNYLRGLSFFDDYFRSFYHQRTKIHLMDQFLKSLPNNFFIHAFNAFYLDRISNLLIKWSLILVSAFSLWTLFNSEEMTVIPKIFLGISVSLSIFLYLKPNWNYFYFLIILTFSQLFSLVSIHSFYEDALEHLFLYISVVAIFFLIYSLYPALRFWSRSILFTKISPYLGLNANFPKRHFLFLFVSVVLTGAPGTFEFFIQEGILNELWSKSHLFLSLVLITMNLNTIHVFKIGQHAFLGNSQKSV